MAEKPRNIYEKILSAHLLEGALIPGEDIGIKIDQTLTQDATGTMAYLQFESLNVSRVRTELSVSYVDHNTLQQGFENADDHKYLETAASPYGVLFSKSGNGICHQVHIERFASPKKTLLGSDSHTPTAGAIGSLAIGAGGLDVALAMAGKPFYLTAPRVIKIELSGILKPYVTAKDIILHLLEVLTTKGNVGFSIEYGGEPVKGPNIKGLPKLADLGGTVHGIVTIKVGDKVTTDHIVPAGPRLLFRSNIEKYARFVFEGLDEAFAQRAIENRQRKLANIIIAGSSYGQGSSREHAALCPAYLGVKVVVAKSIERIHRQNLINFGIVPLLFAHEGDYDRIEEMDSIEIPEIRSRLAQRSGIVASNNTKHTRIPLRHDLSEREVRILLKGGKLNYYAD